MSERLPDLERALLRDLVRLAEERARAERDLQQAFEARNEAAATEHVAATLHNEKEHQDIKATTETEYERARREIVNRHEAGRASAEDAATQARRRVNARYAQEKEAAEAAYQEAGWTATALWEGAQTNADAQRQEYLRKLAACGERLAHARAEAEHFLGCLPTGEVASEPADDATADMPGLLKARVELADALLAEMKGARVPRIIAWLRPAAGRRVRGQTLDLARMLADAERLCETCRRQFETNYQRQVTIDREQHDARQQRAKESFDRHWADVTRLRDEELSRLATELSTSTEAITRRRDLDLASAEATYPRRLRENHERFESETARIEEAHRRAMADSRARRQADWDAMARAWEEGLGRVGAAVSALNHQIGRLFPHWADASWTNWQPVTELPPAIRFGEFTLDLASIPQGLPSDQAVRARGPTSFSLPALLPLPDQCSVVFQAGDGGLGAAEAALRMLLFRLLAALPPAKVRFTILDPVGLGQGFAAFMHLADHDEQLVTGRIWTEQQHIEARLADLTAHMETVIQKYLRNQFANIAQYNAQAGEVAEPFRFLVVANFPANFSPEAARRLQSIVASGARCGVFTLITADPKLPLPPGFDWKDLRRGAVTLVWNEGCYRWKDPDFGAFPFRLDPPPDDSFLTRLLQVVGKKAKEASRVEVPFEFITPPEVEWWARDSRAGVDVALGRSGATKRQHLRLGQGTAQHVLVAGKTGSGKSTLLHALITNLALLYRPEEIELYLVDFKEGVEFKAYATYELPHARLVAIESEREFGLSVLQRLEAELKARGDRFRSAGVQDISAYRQADDRAMPRILLIVDEFQLFFVEDDKIAQEAALLLDRLVRQGRAFGIHVLLGSQTLGGAYSLARSTIGQMAVRIALQCSEADAHLILSDDNPAARLLSRPGEAIYNDANGRVEGNDFFQVVWLSEERREEYLRRIRDIAERVGYQPPQPQIVFEGNAPAELAKNQCLRALLERPAWSGAPRASQAWLGEAMAIKDPTAATFRRQTGSNLLLIGQFDEQALTVLTAAILSLAAQHAPAEGDGPRGGANFFILDGTPVDSPHAGWLPKLGARLPHPVRVGGWRDLPAILADVAAETERRQKVHDRDFPSVFLVIYGLQRFRDLRRAEDDFGFSSRRGESAPPSPAKLCGTILREGPGLGVHTLVWCDNLTNVNRALDRQGLREFEMKVLFQMSAADSSNLIDTPAAGKLGLYRALFHSEDRGQPEKFRPYGLPEAGWLEWVRGRLVGRDRNLTKGCQSEEL
jgi:hypothetical protein